MADAPELMPCPFCGGEAGSCPDPNHSTGWDIGCFNGACEIEPHVWAVHRSTAEMQWNTRATPPAAVVEAMERALRPFAFFNDDNPDEDIQTAWETRYRDRFRDWIDFEDIEAVRAALAALTAWRAGK